MKPKTDIQSGGEKYQHHHHIVDGRCISGCKPTMTPHTLSQTKKEIMEGFDNYAMTTWDISTIDQKNVKAFLSKALDDMIKAVVEELRLESIHRLDSPRSFGDDDTVNVASGYNQAVFDLNQKREQVMKEVK